MMWLSSVEQWQTTYSTDDIPSQPNIYQQNCQWEIYQLIVNKPLGHKTYQIISNHYTYDTDQRFILQRPDSASM